MVSHKSEYEDYSCGVWQCVLWWMDISVLEQPVVSVCRITNSTEPFVGIYKIMWCHISEDHKVQKSFIVMRPVGYTSY